MTNTFPVKFLVSVVRVSLRTNPCLTKSSFTSPNVSFLFDVFPSFEQSPLLEVLMHLLSTPVWFYLFEYFIQVATVSSARLRLLFILDMDTFSINIVNALRQNPSSTYLKNYQLLSSWSFCMWVESRRAKSTYCVM